MKCLASLTFYLFSPTCLINSIKHEHSCKILYLQQWKHSCKILYICNNGSIHVRSSISAIRGALMWDALYLQRGEHSGKILSICNKENTDVRSTISHWLAISFMQLQLLAIDTIKYIFTAVLRGKCYLCIKMGITIQNFRLGMYFIGYMSLEMWFPTMWHFDKCRLKRACAASF